jgi:hypothetical protein
LITNAPLSPTPPHYGRIAYRAPGLGQRPPPGQLDQGATRPARQPLRCRRSFPSSGVIELTFPRSLHHRLACACLSVSRHGGQVEQCGASPARIGVCPEEARRLLADTLLPLCTPTVLRCDVVPLTPCFCAPPFTPCRPCHPSTRLLSTSSGPFNRRRWSLLPDCRQHLR